MNPSKNMVGTPVMVVITRIRTVPYTDDEVKVMSKEQHVGIKIDGYEKVVDEVVVERFIANNLDTIRNQIMAICTDTNTAIIAYMGDAFKERFLFNEGYDPLNKTGICEIILHQRKNPQPSESLSPSKTSPHINGKRMLNPAFFIHDDDTIICRIFSRSRSEIAKTEDYFLQSHKPHGRGGAIDNTIDIWQKS